MSASDAPTVPARHVEGHLEGGIYWQGWLPEGDPRAVVVVAHGAMEHGGRYRYVVERLVPEHYAVYAVDHRGHGRSPGRRGNIQHMRSVVADLDRLVDHARRAHPGRKTFLLGHSLGGAIAIAYAIVHQEKLDGLALSAPLAQLDAPFAQRLAVRAVSAVAPDAGVLAIGAEGVSRDPAEVAAYEADPLNGHGKMPARLVAQMLETTARFEADSPKLTLPLLVMIGTADRLVPVAGAQMVHDRAQSTDKTLHLYDGFFHEIFNEPAGDRDRPLNDLAAWLAEHTTP
jgi:acylglycerol lipase